MEPTLRQPEKHLNNSIDRDGWRVFGSNTPGIIDCGIPNVFCTVQLWKKSYAEKSPSKLYIKYKNYL